MPSSTDPEGPDRQLLQGEMLSSGERGAGAVGARGGKKPRGSAGEVHVAHEKMVDDDRDLDREEPSVTMSSRSGSAGSSSSRQTKTVGHVIRRGISRTQIEIGNAPMPYKLVTAWAAIASVFIYSPRLQKIAEQYRFHVDGRTVLLTLTSPIWVSFLFVWWALGNPRLGRTVLLTLTSPIWVSFLFVWWALGNPRLVSFTGFTAMLSFYLSRGGLDELGDFNSGARSFAFDSSVADAAFLSIGQMLLSFLVVTLKPYQSQFRRLLASAHGPAFAIYLIVKLSGFSFGDPSHTSLSRGVFIISLLFSILLIIVEYWVPTSLAGFQESERQLADTCAVNVETKKAAGLSYFHVNRHPKGELPKMVLMHGFAAGKGFFVPTIDELSEHFEVFIVDWLGNGQSDRDQTPLTSTSQTEALFVDALERWRQEVGIDKFILAGHSLGGYMSGVYALKYPDAVSHLVLASPVGLPEPKDFGNGNRTLSIIRFLMTHIFWNRITPQRMCRFLGPLGPMCLRYIVSLRWGDLDYYNIPALSAYTYHCNCAPASVYERSLYKILLPGVFARDPLISRLPDLKMRTTFLYGESDWMDSKSGEIVSSELNARGVPASVHIVHGAGHQVFVESRDTFNGIIIEQCSHRRSSSSRHTRKTATSGMSDGASRSIDTESDSETRS